MSQPKVSRREREILDVLYRRGAATVAEVQKELAGSPSYSATRTLLGILETKGHVRHTQEKLRFVYAPTVSREKARSGALKQLLRTFFDGSPELAIAALLDSSERRLSVDELKRILGIIAKAKKEGR